MKTIQISEGLWKRLRVEAAERGVTMREVVEEMGAAWVSVPLDVSRAKVYTNPPMVGDADVRELKVELEEGG